MVVIRLARGGRSHRPVYTIVATDVRSSRDGRFLERLGKYHPQAEKGKELEGVKVELIKAWLDKGATIRHTVRTLLKRNQIHLLKDEKNQK